jgi:5-formyltetrahydrofolate cyclo-ligase
MAPGAAELAATNLSLERLPHFKIVAGYQRMGFELDPAPILSRFATVGAIIVLPIVGRENDPLTFATTDAAAVTPDLIIAPLLAFDRAGGRLGQGGGHYDRTIAALRARGPLFVIGLAYAGQEIDAVPHEPHDQRLDAILTEIGYIEVRKDI